MNLLELALGAGALYVTDIMIAPFFSASEFTMFLKFLLQAWILKILYSGVISNISYNSGSSS